MTTNDTTDLGSKLNLDSSVEMEFPTMLCPVIPSSDWFDIPTSSSVKVDAAQSVPATFHYTSTGGPVSSKDQFQCLQAWEGVVLQLLEDKHFVARIVDSSGRERPQDVELPLEEIPDADMNLVAEGAVFYWKIGYRTAAHGQKSRTSEIRFRRLPRWTQAELDEAHSQAEELAHGFGWK